MSIIKNIKQLIGKLLQGKAKDIFGVENVESTEIDSFVQRCLNIYKGMPEWLDKEDNIITINFAKTVCSELATLTTLAIGIRLSGSARADYLQKVVNKIYYSLRKWVEYGLARGTIALKFNGSSVDLFTNDFCITESNGDEVTGAMFFYSKKVKTDYYTRIEYHRFAEDGVYLIDNKCFKGYSQYDLNESVNIKDTVWKDMAEKAQITDLEKPLFAIFRTPGANDKDIYSTLGMPKFSEALQELKDLDIAYSRFSEEVEDSRRTVLVDSNKLFPFQRGNNTDMASMSDVQKKRMKLPRFVRMVDGGTSDQKDFYEEINPSLNTQSRVDGINFLLSVIGYKCGFSNGYFTFDAKRGVVTATQIESEDQRTIQTVKDLRDCLQKCLEDLIYSIDAMADLYGLAPDGEYEVVFDFGDITYNRDEDRARWLQYVNLKYVPAWKFFVKFEGMTEEEAKEMVAEAAPVQQESLFPE